MAPWKLAGMAWLTLGGAATFGVDERELDCEQASAKLADCCGDEERFRGFYCQFDGCTEPTLSEATIECIESLSCSEIVGAGYCELPERPETVVATGDELCAY